jgi:hypothetical protein
VFSDHVLQLLALVFEDLSEVGSLRLRPLRRSISFLRRRPSRAPLLQKKDDPETLPKQQHNSQGSRRGKLTTHADQLTIFLRSLLHQGSQASHFSLKGLSN